MPEVRGKFRVTEITRNDWNPQSSQIKLEAVYTGSPEDNTYAEATPYGAISMTVNKPAAVEKLALGKSFYVDFTPAE